MDPLNSDEAALDLAGRLDERSSPVALSAVSVHELLFGVHLKYGGIASLGKKLAEAEQDLAPFEVFPFDLETAKTSARLLGELARRGEVIGVNDAYVAATALQKGLRSLTRYVSDFKRVEGLRIEKY